MLIIRHFHFDQNPVYSKGSSKTVEVKTRGEEGRQARPGLKRRAEEGRQARPGLKRRAEEGRKARPGSKEQASKAAKPDRDRRKHAPSRQHRSPPAPCLRRGGRGAWLHRGAVRAQPFG